MTRTHIGFILLALAAAAALQPTHDAPAPQPSPSPAPAPAPRPKPRRPCPGPGPCPSPSIVGKIAEGGPVASDGTEVACDLPVSQRVENVGSKIDRAGMCVMSSCEMSARWANLECLRGLRDWCAREPGGGYPSKVDRQLAAFCQSRSQPVPSYLQYEGRDEAVLRAALATGRMPAVTYSGRDGVRYSGTIAHMTNLVHLDDRWAVVLDNNAIGEDQLLWMTPAEFLDRWRGKGNGWAVVFLAPPPPPTPRNGEGGEGKNPGVRSQESEFSSKTASRPRPSPRQNDER